MPVGGFDRAEVSDFYSRMDEWQGEMPNAPFTADAYRFIQEIGRRRKA